MMNGKGLSLSPLDRDRGDNRCRYHLRSSMKAGQDGGAYDEREIASLVSPS